VFDKAWELQDRVEQKIEHFKMWFVKKIGILFFIGLLGMSMFAYGIISLLWYGIYDTWMSDRICFFVNPILYLVGGMIAFCFSAFTIMSKIINNKKQIHTIGESADE
jgi:hypothetical protein